MTPTQSVSSKTLSLSLSLSVTPTQSVSSKNSLSLSLSDFHSVSNTPKISPSSDPIPNSSQRSSSTPLSLSLLDPETPSARSRYTLLRPQHSPPLSSLTCVPLLLCFTEESLSLTQLEARSAIIDKVKISVFNLLAHTLNRALGTTRNSVTLTLIQ